MAKPGTSSSRQGCRYEHPGGCDGIDRLLIPTPHYSWCDKQNEKRNPDIIVPGHGYYIIGPEQIKKELNNIRNILSKAIEDKKAPTQ
jgi:hypothetical protein